MNYLLGFLMMIFKVSLNCLELSQAVQSVLKQLYFYENNLIINVDNADYN